MRTSINTQQTQSVFFGPLRHSKTVQQECVPTSQQLGCCWRAM